MFLTTLLMPAVALAADPTPISACTTISVPGSYQLTRNLTSAQDCIFISTDAVTLDLNGFVIARVGGVGNAYGVASTGGVPRAEITVKNGTVARYTWGLHFSQDDGVVIDNVRATEHTVTGITVGPNSVVRNSRVQFSGCGNGCWGISAGEGSQLIDNVAEDIGGWGIIAGASSVVRGNVSRNAVNDGIRVGAGSTVRGNVTSGNGEDGLDVTCPSVVAQSAATSNGLLNLRTTNAGCVLVDNVAP
ncbi:MAG: right-handed parallel beta-helix repeat-containing protein [Alphaproteobacteria bacterium]|nr:right-handed parallel beta-helix repeat-containing protein [Alphaproteobacteria bacterium]MCB9699204.1 right-handed parallel beta-helix repeat-containing protein [Alphaproteobacteria bacterium]